MKELLLILILASPGCVALPSQVTAPPQGKNAPAPPASSKFDAEQMLEDVRALSSDAMEGRGVGTPGGERARAYAVRRFGEAGLRPLGASFEQPFTLSGRNEGRRGANVLGHIRGRKHPERFIVVTAHYDHLGVKDGQIYNGADDNASGVAALLALAAHFSRQPPDHSLVFAALDAEESGLQGARALVEWLAAEKRDVTLNVNLDMVSRSERGELHAAGTYHYPSLRPHLERVAARAPVKLLLGHDRPELGRDDWTSQSDHFAFHRAGIPFVYFGVEDHKDYHRPTDDFGAITPDFYLRAAETILDALRTFDENLTAIAKEKARR